MGISGGHPEGSGLHEAGREDAYSVPLHGAWLHIIGVVESACHISTAPTTGEHLSRRIVRIADARLPVTFRGEPGVRLSEKIAVGDLVEIRAKLTVHGKKEHELVFQIDVENADVVCHRTREV